MVPVKITLSNFLSYGSKQQTLDFTRFHVACLSGKNGQGKSALLDALTWALWGEARKSSGAQKPDEDLLRIGSRSMNVECVFDVQGDRYRVLRTFSKSATGKTSKSTLEFQLVQHENVIPLTGASLRETQAKIDDRLGLDYDAFVNSALLLQGRSDEFTRRKPSERKSILGKILNLSKYDRLAEKAKACISELRTVVDKLEREIEILNEIVSEEESRAEEHNTLTKALLAAEKSVNEIKQKELSLLSQYSEFQAMRIEHRTLKETIDQIGVQREIRMQEAKELDAKLKGAENLIERREEIKQKYNNYEELQREREELDNQREIYRGIEANLHASKSTMEVEKSSYLSKIARNEYELKLNQQKLQELEREVALKGSLDKKIDKA